MYIHGFLKKPGVGEEGQMSPGLVRTPKTEKNSRFLFTLYTTAPQNPSFLQIVRCHNECKQGRSGKVHETEQVSTKRYFLNQIRLNTCFFMSIRWGSWRNTPSVLGEMHFVHWVPVWLNCHLYLHTWIPSYRILVCVCALIFICRCVCTHIHVSYWQYRYHSSGFFQLETRLFAQESMDPYLDLHDTWILLFHITHNLHWAPNVFKIGLKY